MIKILRNGGAVRSSDIAEKISESGNETAPPRISAILSRISNPEKCGLGFFIEKVRSGNAFVYQMKEELLKIPEEKLYDLALSPGSAAPRCGTAPGCGDPGRYTLEQALQEFPELRRYVAPRFPADTGNSRHTAEAAAYRPGPDASLPDKKIEINFRYSDKYSISASASASVFLTVCAALVLLLTVCGIIAYLFFFPLFITVTAAGIILAVRVWKIRFMQG